MPGQQHLGAGHDVPRLRVVKAAGADVFLDFLHVGFRKGLQRRKALKKRRSYHIHPLVRTLGGQTHGKQQLVVLPPVERAVREGVGLLQTGDYFCDLFWRSHINHRFRFF